MTQPKQAKPTTDAKAEAARKVQEAMQSSNEDNTDSNDLDFSDLEELTQIAEKVNPSKKSALKTTTNKTHFEEWMVELHMSNGERIVNKIKLNRERVLMSDEQAQVLNEGVLNMDLQQNNRLPLMYYPVK